MANDFGISGWEPAWAPAHRVVDAHRDALVALRGRRIVDSWLVWNLALDEWFADLPVVLAMDDGRHLEVCWQKFDDLSLTRDTIDVEVAPEPWDTWPLEWRAGGHPALAGARGQQITSVAVTLLTFTPRQVLGVGPDTGDDWLVGGLWLGCGEHGVWIYNALDENGLADRLPEPGAHDRVEWLTPTAQ